MSAYYKCEKCLKAYTRYGWYINHLSSVHRLSIKSSTDPKFLKYAKTVLEQGYSNSKVVNKNDVIVSRRGWNVVVTDKGFRLSSPIEKYVPNIIWNPFETYKAECYVSPGQASQGINCCNEPPGINCSCGIYSLKKIEDGTVPGSLYGTLKSWGKYVEGTDGYRVQFAYPSEFTHVACHYCRDIIESGISTTYMSTKKQYMIFLCRGCAVDLPKRYTVPSSYVLDELRREYGLQKTDSVDDFLKEVLS